MSYSGHSVCLPPTRPLGKLNLWMTSCLFLAFVLGTSPHGQAQRSRVYQRQLTAHWQEDGEHFWYRRDGSGGVREYVLVDALRGSRELAFDHARLATALRAALKPTAEDRPAGTPSIDAERLELHQLRFDQAKGTATFTAYGASWLLDRATYELKRQPSDAGTELGQASNPLRIAGRRPSRRTGPDTEIEFRNQTQADVELFWINGEGRQVSYGKLAAGTSRSQHTFAGHIWRAWNESEQVDVYFEAAEASQVAFINRQPYQGRSEESGARQRRSGRGRSTGRGRTTRFSDLSPDGKWRAFVRDDNVVLRAAEDPGEERTLTADGTAEAYYDLVQWSPDSKTIVAFRVEPGDNHEVHLVESSPQGGGRARLHSRRYPLPGDKFPVYEMHLFSLPSGEHRVPQVDRIDFGRPRLRWLNDGRRFTYEKTDRGHQRYRLIEVDTHTGLARTLVDEASQTFVFTYANPNGRIMTYLENSYEMIWASEKDGWRHLYRVDGEQGQVVQQITRGEWVVRGIDRIDEDQRQIWFRASGIYKDQDPYLVHFARINFDGTGLVLLTDGNGTHSVEYSPNNKYLIATYSRMDLPPTHELRRVEDGGLICRLEQANIEELVDRGFKLPEVFSAKGRDGKTDIWGLITRPRDFDPQKRYPVIEYIYAGPHDSHVPKAFIPSPRFSDLTDLGFVVVQVDGMGTANRSKAFHDVCWQNLKDAGFPDRIAWHQAVAKKYPWYDLTRVGIYGTSAGGQNSTGAMLFHGDFYHVAVSACGCHDNRMDKASWNEQWMGYPVGPHYAASSNIEHADRLQGKLLLIVGEMDTNVPPESTLRLADALIKADKDFDLLVVPGAGHGNGGRYGERRRNQFFIKHLLSDRE